MKWQFIESSVLSSVGYVSEQQMLYLRFRSGEVYRYCEFPLKLYRSFLEAESKGRFFSTNIRDRFRCERMARLEVVSKDNAVERYSTPTQ